MISMRSAVVFPAGCLLACSLAWADYPERPVRIIVPYEAGGGADMITRLVALRLGNRLKQSVIVENRGGGSNTIGMNAVAKSTADGYTLGLVTPTFVMTPLLIKNHPYKPLADFAAVGMVATAPLALVVHPSVPARSVQELIAIAKARPGQLNFASGGVTSTQGLAGVLFASMADIDVANVPYKGSSQAMTDLLAGNVQFMFNPMASVLPHIASGKLRAVGVSSEVPASLLPGVGTVAAAVPGYHVTGWFGLVAPAGTPGPVVDRLNRELASILEAPGVAEQMKEWGLEPKPMAVRDFTALLEAESRKYAEIIKTQNLALE
ncbi:tripartite tricarboxylate transporter substrate binding protein [Pigmentiphaga sp.]|uniref:tripartite tricarboxylate transporter substrate binding protein n=1 Tax=Pigmentiphaga sp. TaxID=1977564 RepID=UPI0025D65FBE|nr:tripartite tricarboxylate transporter substrate binding protein [Pigmentiphaga sp.]